jgi:hypothetical protein
MRHVDTSTHTVFDESHRGEGLLSESLADALSRSLNRASPLRSTGPRTVTAPALLASDTRFAVLSAPSSPHVGPGSYAIERALPSVGLFATDSNICSSSPARDPYRGSPSFLSPQRPGGRWVPPGDGSDAVYVDPKMVSAFRVRPSELPYCSLRVTRVSPEGWPSALCSRPLCAALHAAGPRARLAACARFAIGRCGMAAHKRCACDCKRQWHWPYERGGQPRAPRARHGGPPHGDSAARVAGELRRSVPAQP